MTVNLDHYILVLCGIFLKDHEHIPLNVIWMYNLYTEQWRKHTLPHRPTVPTGRCSTSAVVIHSHVYVFGGYAPSESPRTTNALWKLAMDNAGSFVWSNIVMTNDETTPSPWYYHTGWEYAEKLAGEI